MPMKTTFVRPPPSPSADATRAIVSTCERISPADSCRRKPCAPVAQKVQPIAQPACVEMQTVRRARRRPKGS